jgi:hypothetical protein
MKRSLLWAISEEFAVLELAAELGRRVVPVHPVRTNASAVEEPLEDPIAVQ